jgi:hypothetical protein
MRHALVTRLSPSVFAGTLPAARKRALTRAVTQRVRHPIVGLLAVRDSERRHHIPLALASPTLRALERWAPLQLPAAEVTAVAYGLVGWRARSLFSPTPSLPVHGPQMELQRDLKSHRTRYASARESSGSGQLPHSVNCGL